jgi:hypothetical protein
VKKGIEALENCEEMISKLGLFSSNETKEDISTTNLKYILVMFKSVHFLSLFYFIFKKKKYETLEVSN